jgi:hypothetical protein
MAWIYDWSFLVYVDSSSVLLISPFLKFYYRCSVFTLCFHLAEIHISVYLNPPVSNSALEFPHRSKFQKWCLWNILLIVVTLFSCRRSEVRNCFMLRGPSFKSWPRDLLSYMRVFSAPPANAGIVLQIRPWPLHFLSFWINSIEIIQTSELLKAWNNLGTNQE